MQYFVHIAMVLFVVAGPDFRLVVGEQKVPVRQDSVLLDEVGLDCVVGVA